MSNNTKLLALMQRPLEPTFYPKDNGKTVIEMPENFLTDRYRPIGQDLQTRFGTDADNTILVRSVAPPNIAFAQVVDKRGAFSLFIPQHRNIAGKLIELFVNQPDVDTLMSVASYCRDRLNAVLFQYALAVAVQHRKDTTNLNIPSFVQLFPDQFVDPSVFPKLREEGAIVTQANRMVIDIPPNYTASEREPEQRLGYWREDIGVNMHHWHWHLVFPGDGPLNIVQKDRRGELFFYMHNQIISRYNVERFCNKLGRVVPMNNLREPIPEAYFPKMIRSSNNRSYPPRTANQTLKDLDRVDNNTIVQIADLERWTSRVFEAIDSGFATDSSGKRVALDEVRGIDILGDIVESSILTINRELYGNLHGHGHNVIAYIHDPDNRFLEDYGVMGEFTTAMRDPTFYRWHSFIDNVFLRHKDRLSAYNNAQLSFSGVTVTNVSAQLTRAKAPPNILLTYWQRSQVDLATGLDFGPEGNVFASFTHIQHAPFNWKIDVNNAGAVRRGTCRIFIAPKVDERGSPLQFREQRRYMIEMDKFTVVLNPGVNQIVRRDDQSSITIPYERTFRQVGTAQMPTDPNALAQFRLCGCGWPAHMLLPKGSAEGVQFDMFVMISDFKDDTVNQEFDENADCNDAHSFCGLRDKLYPDKRSMGFPFDRKTPDTIRTIQDFIGSNSNMRAGDIQIRFNNTVIART